MGSISVIIPVYDHVRYLTDCIESVIIQPEVSEVIIVDDGSTDGSYELALELRQRDERILVAQHPEGDHKGAAASRNLGIQHSTAEWITFLDADDYYLEKRFSNFIQIDKSDISGTYEDVISHYADDSLIHTIPKSTGLSEAVWADDLFDYLVGHQAESISIISLIIKRSAIEVIGLFDESLTIGEDTDFIWRAAKKGFLINNNNGEPKVVRRVHGENTYHSEKSLVKGRYQFYKKWDRYSSHKRVRSGFLYYQYLVKKAGADNSFDKTLQWAKYQWRKVFYFE